MIALHKPLDRLLKEWEQQRLLTALDRHFALEMSTMHADSTPLFTFICALLSRQLSLQHPAYHLTSLTVVILWLKPQLNVSYWVRLQS